MSVKSALFIGVVTSAVLTACTPAPEAPPSEAPLSEWAVTTQQDLRDAHAIMLENHPGPKDAENPGFMKQAGASFENAMELSKGVTDQAGYAASLLAYTAGFRDGHFGVFANAQNTGEATFNWPGMMPAWRAGHVKIAHAEPQENEFLGAELLSCDGRSMDDLMEQSVFQFDTGKPDQEAYWARKAYNLFLDAENPFITRPHVCKFKLTSGERVTHELTWRKAPNKVFNTLRWQTSFGARPNIGMEEIRPGEFWINLSDFSPNDEGAAKMRAIFAEVKTRREDMQNAKSIVFDMRGNQGGSSTWGNDMIEALWGKAYPESRHVDHDAFVEWRLSEGNVKHMGWIVDYLLKNGHEDTANNYFGPIYEASQKALKAGDDLYREPEDDDTAPMQSREVINPVKAPVYVLTHGTCASACLDFMDGLFELEGVTHIGYPTSSDTNYMEIRMQDLPSGLAKMAIPTKVYRNRARKSGEFYDPVHRYDGFDWSDEAIKAWAKTVTDG